MTRPRLAVITSHDYWLRPFRTSFEKRYQVSWTILPPLPPPLTFGSFIKFPFIIFARRLKVVWNILRSKAVFVEWANDNLGLVSKLVGKRSLFCRLHRYEIFSLPDVRWERVSAMIVVNSKLAEQLLEQVPELDGRIHVIHNLLEKEFWNGSSDRKRTYKLGIVGSIIPRKGISTALRAFKEALKFEPRLELVIVGRQNNQEYYQTLLGLVNLLGIKDHVRFMGYVEDLEAFYQNIDIILSFSEHESTQLTIYEGLACGAYPMSLVWDGVDEFLPEKNVFQSETEFLEKIRIFYNGDDENCQEKINKLQLKCLPIFTMPDPRDEFVKLMEGVE